MKISIICVGKLKEKYWNLAIDEYSKRLSKYIKLEIIEVPDEKAPETMSLAEENIKDDAYCVALAIDGKNFSSEELADFIEKTTLRGVSHIVFIIGGSLGLSKEVMNRANYYLSFSKMTFPHQMMRVILLEQIYRAIKINRNEPYHK